MLFRSATGKEDEIGGPSNSISDNWGRHISLVLWKCQRHTFDKPKIAAAYAMAAQYMGMRFVYLEAGSGSKQSVTPEMVQTVISVFDGFLMVGGGIRSAKTASSLIKAGADGLVVGTLLEQTGGLKKFTEMVKSIGK